MLETVRTLLLGAVGAVDLTEEKLRAIVDDLIRRGELAVDEAEALRAQLAARAAMRAGAEDARLRTAVEEALGRYNVASHESVVALQARLAALEDAVTRLVPPATGS